MSPAPIKKIIIIKNVNIGRDFKVEAFADLRVVERIRIIVPVAEVILNSRVVLKWAMFLNWEQNTAKR